MGDISKSRKLVLDLDFTIQRMTSNLIYKKGWTNTEKWKEYVSSLNCTVKWDIYAYHFRSVVQSCLTLCNPRDCDRPGLPVHHQLLELSQTHVHWVGDAIQPSHPLSSPSPPALNLSQHQGLLQWLSSSHQVAKILELQLYHQSFQKYSGLISFRIDRFDFLSAQGTLKSLLQHHSTKT